jgi:four helix bundle protein
MAVRYYRDLLVWQKGIALAREVYELTKGFPREERYGLASQVQRAAVSVPSNIAEGQARKHTAEFRHFLYQALGSLAEVDTQLFLAQDLKYLDKSEVVEAEGLIGELQRIIHTLAARLPPARVRGRS